MSLLAAMQAATQAAVLPSLTINSPPGVCSPARGRGASEMVLRQCSGNRSSQS